MEQTDKDILKGLLANRVGQVVCDVLSKHGYPEEDIHMDVMVSKPSCYVDDEGGMHNGRLITVYLNFMSEERDDED